MSPDLQLALVGDVMLGRMVNDRLRRLPAEYPWGDTLPVMYSADWRGCNLECVISDLGTPWQRTPKAFRFRSDKKNAAVLEAARIDVVTLANNHTLDFGADATASMLRTLNAAGIGHTGAGLDLNTATRPAEREVRGVRLAVLSFTDNQPEWEATPSGAGVWYVPTDLHDSRCQRLLQLVDSTRQRVDLLITAVHWGGNWGYTPPRDHVDLGHALIGAGADLVFGHSAHVVRAIEVFQGKPIIYSAGDFIDDYAVDPIERNDRSFVFVVEVEAGEPRRLRLYPTVIRDLQARLARGPEAIEIGAKMMDLCKGFATRASWCSSESCLIIEIERPRLY
jgi:poly-gamma-glutamate synthesis protein (capsule biosynthesis protein)